VFLDVWAQGVGAGPGRAWLGQVGSIGALGTLTVCIKMHVFVSFCGALYAKRASLSAVKAI